MRKARESREPGMDTSAKAVRFDDNSMWVELSDGRTLGVPYAWFPRLLNATPAQREVVEIGRFGLHWEDIDEDISIAGLLAGRRDRTADSQERGSTTKEPGLDGRHRDKDGEIQRKRSDTQNKNLSKPIPQFSPDTTLGEMRKKTGKISEANVRSAAAKMKR
jgi:hypothetical protein